MWLIDGLRQRKHDRRFKAATVVLLGAYMFDRLEPGERAQVEAEMNANFNRSDNPAAAWRRWGAWDVLAAFRAAAMERAGVELRIDGLSWSDLFKPWNHWRRLPMWPLMTGFDIRPAYLINDFRPMDAATLEAKEFLRRNGMEIPDADPSRMANEVAV